MAIFTFGDLHLSLGTDKPMDIFAGWADYVERLRESWLANISPEDTVVLAGDTSWAMQLAECEADFSFIHGLPGKKLLLKGNHDYWWSTMRKMEEYVAAMGFDSIRFLFNNAYSVEGHVLCGTRGWILEPGEANDTKVAAREAGRLRLSLEAARALAPGVIPLVFLHYPPLARETRNEEILALLKEYGIRRCYYGHLHGRAAIKRAVQGVVDGTEYKLISADALEFSPLLIA